MGMVTFYSYSYRDRIGNIHEEYISVDSWTKAEIHVFMEQRTGKNGRLGPNNG